MKLFDKILDVYYNAIFKIEDIVTSVKYKVVDLVDGIKGHKSELDAYVGQEIDLISEEPVKKTKKKKTSKKKKK